MQSRAHVTDLRGKEIQLSRGNWYPYLYEIKMEIFSDGTNFTTMVRHELITVLALRLKKKHFEELDSTHENSIWQLVNAIPLCLLNFMSSYMILRV